MKILHLLTDSSVGGAGMMLSYLAPHLSSHFDLSVALPKENPLGEELEKQGVRVFRICPPSGGAASLLYAPPLLSLLRSLRPSILHTHAFPLCRLMGRICKVPVCVTTKHCDLPAPWQESKALRYLYNQTTDMTVSTSLHMHRALSDIDIPSVFIPNGVATPLPFSEREKEEFRRALGLRHGDRLLGVLSRLVSVKGIDTVISALAKCPESYHLLLIGDGPEKQRLSALTRRFGLSGRVHFFGFLKNGASYLSLCDLLISASRASETSPLVIAEAAALSVPTVASDIPGHRERLFGGGGLLFPVDDSEALSQALMKALQSPLYERLSALARERYESDFSDRLMGARYLSLYRELLSKKRLKNFPSRGMIKI